MLLMKLKRRCASLSVCQLLSMRFTNSRAQCQPCEPHAQAHVRATAAERHVRVGITLQVDAKWLVKDPFVAVTGNELQHHFVTGVDGLVMQFDVFACGAANVHGWRGPANEFFDGGLPAFVVRRAQLHDVSTCSLLHSVL